LLDDYQQGVMTYMC